MDRCVTHPPRYARPLSPGAVLPPFSLLQSDHLAETLASALIRASSPAPAPPLPPPLGAGISASLVLRRNAAPGIPFQRPMPAGCRRPRRGQHLLIRLIVSYSWTATPPCPIRPISIERCTACLTPKPIPEKAIHV